MYYFSMRSHHDLSLFKEESLLSLDLLCTCKKFDENITQIVHDNDCAVESPHDHNVNVVLNITSVNDVPAYIVSMNVNDNEYVFHPRTLTSQAQINSFFSIPVVESCTTKLRITVKKNGNDIDSDDYKTLGGGFSLMCRMRDDPKNGHTHSMYPEKKVQVLKDLNKNRDLLFDQVSTVSARENSDQSNVFSHARHHVFVAKLSSNPQVRRPGATMGGRGGGVSS